MIWPAPSTHDRFVRKPPSKRWMMFDLFLILRRADHGLDQSIERDPPCLFQRRR